MSDSAVLLDHRDVILSVFTDQLVTFGISSLIDKELRCPQMFSITGNPVELAQSHFDDLVSRHFTTLAGAERATDEIGAPKSYVEQIAFACSKVMSCRSLVEMSDGVEFMTSVFLPHPSVLSTRRRIGRVHELSGSIKVSVFFLCGADESDDTVDVVIELRIRMKSE